MCDGTLLLLSIMAMPSDPARFEIRNTFVLMHFKTFFIAGTTPDPAIIAPSVANLFIGATIGLDFLDVPSRDTCPPPPLGGPAEKDHRER